MSTSFIKINNLADESLAHIIAFLSPDERVRSERVCRKWRDVAKKYAWTEFRRLKLDRRLSAQGSHHLLALAQYRALIDRSAPHLRELRIPWLGGINYVEQWKWSVMRNLRHLRFDTCVGSDVFRAITGNMTRLKSIHFSDIRCHPLPLHCTSPPALPSTILSLQISDCTDLSLLGERKQHHINELLEIAASCCRQLAMLMLPTSFAVNKPSLAKLARFEKLFYLRLSFDLSDGNLFADTLAKSGSQLRALLLQEIDSTVLGQIVKHCPLLEHCSFCINYYTHAPEGDGLFSALQSMFQLVHLRSISISYDGHSEQIRTKILTAIDGMKAKGNIEYLHLSLGLPVPVEFIIKLIQLNPLRKLTCAIQDDHTPAGLDMLNNVLQDMDGTFELELFGHCPPKLEMAENSRITVLLVRENNWPESISQPMLREFWARSMQSVPELGHLDK